MVECCLRQGTFDQFLDHLLFRFGYGRLRLHAEFRVAEQWDKTFDLETALDTAADFLGDAFCDFAGRGVREATGYFMITFAAVNWASTASPASTSKNTWPRCTRVAMHRRPDATRSAPSRPI
jgi:hypothetical protein